MSPTGGYRVASDSTEYGEIIQRLTRIETKQDQGAENHDDLIKRLYGNGQPGDIEKLSGRVGELEHFKWGWTGAIAALSACIGGISSVLVAWIKAAWSKG